MIMLLQGCEQVGKALNLPPTAVLCYVILGSYVLSPAVVEVPETNWSEPVLLWLAVSKPTGSGKSTRFHHLINLLKEVRCGCWVMEEEPPWLVDDATFEKLGSLMHENSAWLQGLYDNTAQTDIVYNSIQSCTLHVNSIVYTSLHIKVYKPG